MSTKNYQGQLLASHPGNPKDGDEKSVVFVVSHLNDVCIGLQINHQMPAPSLASICQGMGIWYEGDEPLYWGGHISQNKIHVVHSLDWAGLSTTKITDEIGVTNDVSILAAISRGEGPEHFRSCVGYWLWEHGRLDQQINPKKYPSKEVHRWELVPATLESIFDSAGEEQWVSILEQSARQQVANFF